MIEEEEKKYTLLQLNAKKNISLVLLKVLFFFGRLLNGQTFFVIFVAAFSLQRLVFTFTY